MKINEDLRRNQDIIKEYLEELNRMNSLMVKLDAFKSYTSNLEDVDFSFKDLTAAIMAVEKDLRSYESIKTEIYKAEIRFLMKLGISTRNTVIKTG